MRFITDKMHGVLDYVVALTLIAAPFILGFGRVSGVAEWMSVAAGVALFGYSLVTAYSYSARAFLTFRQHLVVDAVSGAALLAAPFLVGFDGLPRIFYAAVGGAILVVVALTDPNLEEAPTPAELIAR